jgi:hypothetical protein
MPPVQIIQVDSQTATDRIGRYPKHTFNVRSAAFSVQPIGLAPVLPGETLNSLFMESRVITDPIANSITGFKKEYFFFYVKATQLLGDAIRNMFVDIDDNSDLALANGAPANSLAYYTAKGGVNYTELATKAVVNAYFRDEGELWSNVPLINGYPAAQIREQSWLDSLIDKDLVPEQAQLDAAADTGDVERLLTAYEQLRSMGLANITYEEYLATFGIRIDEEKEDRPELLMHTTDFQYPSNTIDPLSGNPSSAVSWVFRQGENKKRKFFREPGFIIGITVTRPKIYFGGLAGSLVSHMTRAWDWMPALLEQMPSSSLRKFEPGTGPLGDRVTDTDGYFVDMRDLLVHGDQFQNRFPFDSLVNVGAINQLALPDVNLNWRYPTDAMVKSLFKDPAGNTFIREDGYFSLSLKGKQRDTTPALNPRLV